MQLKEALKVGTKKLDKSSTPVLDSRLLMGKVLSSTQEKVLLNYNMNLSSELKQEFFKLIARRELMEPIAYIIGKQEFYGLEFYVDKNVLIPRPETELVVDTVLSDYNNRFAGKKVHIVELGVGSGAISIALATQIIAAEITALDICDKALEIASNNSWTYNLSSQIKFIKSNWYSNLGNEKYDYIVSNPPYISKDEKNVMAKETVLYEPELALYANDNGFAAYKTIISSAHKYLKSNGRLVLEMGYAQKDELTTMLHEYQFEIISIKQDLSDLDRVIIAKKCV